MIACYDCAPVRNANSPPPPPPPPPPICQTTAAAPLSPADNRQSPLEYVRFHRSDTDMNLWRGSGGAARCCYFTFPPTPLRAWPGDSRRGKVANREECSSGVYVYCIVQHRRVGSSWAKANISPRVCCRRRRNALLTPRRPGPGPVASVDAGTHASEAQI